MSRFISPPPRRPSSRWVSPGSPPPLHSFQSSPISRVPSEERISRTSRSLRIRTPSPLQSDLINVSYENIDLMRLFMDIIIREEFNTNFWDFDSRVYLTYHPTLCNYKEPEIEPEPLITIEYDLIEPDLEPYEKNQEPDSEPIIQEPDSEPID